MANLLAEWLILAGVCVTDVQAMVENHLKDMILRTFDPKKADTIFTEEGEVIHWRIEKHVKGITSIVSYFMILFIYLDAGMVNGDDRPSYMAIAYISVGRGVSGLFDAQFYHKINIRCWISK